MPHIIRQRPPHLLTIHLFLRPRLLLARVQLRLCGLRAQQVRSGARVPRRAAVFRRLEDLDRERAREVVDGEQRRGVGDERLAAVFERGLLFRDGVLQEVGAGHELGNGAVEKGGVGGGGVDAG